MENLNIWNCWKSSDLENKWQGGGESFETWEILKNERKLSCSNLKNLKIKDRNMNLWKWEWVLLFVHNFNHANDLTYTMYKFRYVCPFGIALLEDIKIVNLMTLTLWPQMTNQGHGVSQKLPVGFQDICMNVKNNIVIYWLYLFFLFAIVRLCLTCDVWNDHVFCISRSPVLSVWEWCQDSIYISVWTRLLHDVLAGCVQQQQTVSSLWETCAT